MSILEDIPAGAVSGVLTLLGAMVRLIRAGDDGKAREAALMQAAEDLKALLDRERFGAG